MTGQAIRTVVIDDEPNSVELISNFIQLLGKPLQLVAVAGSVKEGRQAVLQHQPQLVFLDVQMQDGSGFDLLSSLEKIDFRIIFITAFQEFAIKAFKYSALDYLLKPLSPLQFTEAVSRAEQSFFDKDMGLKLQALMHNMAPANGKKIVLKTFDRIYAVHTPELVRMESDSSYTIAHLAGGKKIMVSRNIKEFDQLLTGNGFMRVHQSHLINTNHVFYFDKQEHCLVMKDDSVVPVATRKKEQVIQLMQSFQ